MKKIIPFVIVAALVYAYTQKQGISISGLEPVSGSAEAQLQAAYRDGRSGIQIEGSGTVAKVLPDDNEGSRHQRFILRLSTGQTLLVAHNVDLAPRIGGLMNGDTVTFYGEYEWNSKGGVIHWTHRDPRHVHVGGWLKHNGRTYQ